MTNHVGLSNEEKFNFAFDFMIVNEGGFSNHPADRGGATKYGITQATLAAWKGHPVSVEQVRQLTLDDVKPIYKRNYWDQNSLDGVHSAPVATCVFDIGVVCGTGSSGKLAQVVANTHGGALLLLDGQIGSKSLSAINGMDETIFVRAFADRVGARFRSIVDNNPSQRVFLAGWMARATRLLTLIKN